MVMIRTASGLREISPDRLRQLDRPPRHRGMDPRRIPAPPPDFPPRKEDAPCCASHRDDLGRLPPGFCGPGCIRRPANWARATTP